MTETAEKTIKSFPFMKLPSELRIMVYKQLLIWQERKLVFSLRSLPRWAKALVLVSKQIRQEAIAIIFGRISIDAFGFQMLADFLYRIGPDCCNAIKEVTIRYWPREDDNKAFKLLAKCASLRKLNINIEGSRLFDITPNPFGKRSGVQDLLKIRGIEMLNVAIKHCGWCIQYDPKDMARDRHTFMEAIQILKQPRGFDELKRLPVSGLRITYTRVPQSTSWEEDVAKLLRVLRSQRG